MNYYTSYETSLALRDAGAPQGPGRSEIGETFWRSYVSQFYDYPRDRPRRLFEVRRTESDWTPGSVDGKPEDGVGEARAFRLDEILAALPTDDRPALRVYLDSGTACVEVLNEDRPVTSSTDGYGNSLVEAAAACWLAVLRAAREAAK